MASDQATSPSAATAVPNSTAMNSGVIAARLIDCMAAIPSAAGRRASASMTKVEKAKNTPATSPLPRAVASVAE